MQTEELTEPDSFFCNFCESYQPASVDHQISKVGSYLVLQLKCFVSHHENFKYIKNIQDAETLSVPVVVDDVSFDKKFNLIAAVNYTGTY